MNYLQKKSELIKLLTEYSRGEISSEGLQHFSWDMIDYFSKHKKNGLPPISDFEKEFWYAIWEIQHLSDEGHEKDGVTQKTLLDALAYLNGTKKIPSNFIGTRP